ncbi:hypothetical protein SUGI_0470780 [Cryptomeria japonica]|nr:hypothetical protein SUGI_0470780 [Cryptomeria japonica]
MGETRVIGEWANVGWDDPPHVPQLVFTKGKWVDMAAQNWLRADLRNFRPVSKYFRGFFRGPSSGNWRKHCLGSNDNPFLDKLLVNGSTGKHLATFEVNQAMRDVGKREVYVVSHDPKSVGLFTSKDQTIAHKNIMVSGDNNVDDLLPNLTTSNSLDKSLNDGGGNPVCPVKSKEYLESYQGIGQIFVKNDGVVSKSNVGVSSLGFLDDAILAQQVKELVSNSLQHFDVDVDNNTALGNNIQLGDIPVIVPDKNLGEHISFIPSNAFNHWNDAFVQSIQTPYAGSEYRERVETLVNEVKMLLRELQSGDNDLIERLEMVDALQCLGIDRYFQAEITEALDYVFRVWDGSVGIGLGCESGRTNLNATALGLRLLRLRRYHVSADALKNFKDSNGHFIICGVNNDEGGKNTREEHLMRSMLNLLRVSSVAYSGEVLMEEAKVFSTEYLKRLLENSGDTYKKSSLKEVEYALVYEWPRTFTRWEAWNFIEIYELDNQRLKDKRILELAKLDFNVLQFQYKLEMKKISSWWVDSGISKLVAIRERSIEYLFWAVSSADEVELSSSRLVMAKATSIITIMDDIFDDYATLEQLKCITEAIAQGWDVSIIKDIPSNLKTCIEFVFKTVLELASDATEKQGRDMMPFVTKAVCILLRDPFNVLYNIICEYIEK